MPSNLLFIVGYFAIFIGAMYFLIIMPQKKREKKSKEMLGGLSVGNQVISIGGIAGKVINIKDDEVTIESSIEKTQIVLKKWAIKEVITPISA